MIGCCQAIWTEEELIIKEQEWAKKALERRGHVLAGSSYLDDILNMDHHIIKNNNNNNINNEDNSEDNNEDNNNNNEDKLTVPTTTTTSRMEETIIASLPQKNLRSRIERKS